MQATIREVTKSTQLANYGPREIADSLLATPIAKAVIGPQS